MNIPDLLILALATWRGAYMLTREAGPWQVFTRLRAATTRAGLLQCTFCASVWVAIVAWLLLAGPLRPVVEVLAVSGAGLMLASFSGVEIAR